jgi:hypothetical protein
MLTSVNLLLSSQSRRSSSRTRQAPITYAEEQASMQLEAQELLDISRAIEASQESDGDRESPDEPAPPDLNSSSEEEEEEKQPPSAWTEETHDVRIPPFDAPTGKQHGARHADSPLSFLQLFLTPGLVQQWVDYTNDYAEQHGAEENWHTTPAELYAFVGVHIYMGICTLPQWHMYWSRDYQQPFVASVFPRWRFEQLLRYFHVAPPPALVAAADPLSRVRPLIQSLQHSFKRHYLPGRDFALDEAIAAYKGRSPIKQYIPSKPHKWGYKMHCLASDDYVLHFEVYEGKEEHPSEHGATYDTVMRMVAGYEHQQHVLYIDSYFTSPAVLDALKQKGIRCCGSVRRNRRGLPPISKEQVRRLGKGEWIKRQQGDTSLAVWKDQKDVWLLYNHTSPLATATLDRWDDSGHKVSIGCPQAVHDYFFNARSVDVSNQLHYSYPTGRKAMRAWPRLAWWLIDISIVNAFQLWSIGREAPKQLTFREELMHDLVKLLGSDRYAVQSSRGAETSVALVRDHFPQRVQHDRRCVECSQRGTGPHRSSFICARCKVHLCIDPCFRLHHK